MAARRTKRKARPQRKKEHMAKGKELGEKGLRNQWEQKQPPGRGRQ